MSLPRRAGGILPATLLDLPKIELGADPTIRDGTYHGTALNWAEYNQQGKAADYLRDWTGN